MQAMLRIVPLLALLLFHSSAYAVDQTVPPTLSEARSLAEQGNDADAITALQQLVAQTPAHFQAWFLLGVTQARQRRFHDAIDAFNKVIALQPQLAEPHNNLAVIYNELGDYRAAVKELEASLKLKPDYTTAQENIGDLYVKLAADAYRKALERDARPDLRQRYEHLLHIRDTQQHDDALDKKTMKTEQSKARQKAANHPLPPSVGKHVAVEKHPSIAAKKQRKHSQQPDGENVQQRQPARVVIAPAVASQSSDQQDAIKSALAAVEAWRMAWNRKDVAAYISAYSPEFDFGSRFKTLAQWKHYKQWAIKKRAFIRVTLERIEATPLPGGTIRLIFLQHFRSGSYNSDDIKQLLLEHTQNGWKIIREISK